MEALATLNNQRQFDFQNNGIEVMDLETLQRTYKENDIYGNPVRGYLPLPGHPAHNGHLPSSQPELRGGGNLRRPE